MLIKTYLHLGSNEGDSFSNLKKAISALGGFGKVFQSSSVYETEAWGNTNQQAFLNQAVEFQTSLLPLELLDAIQEIENKMGRLRSEKWGPRIIDIDILLYESHCVNSDRLNIPHPLLAERNFVLFPLAEIAAKIVHPVLNQTIEELLASSIDNKAVKKATKWQ